MSAYRSILSLLSRVPVFYILTPLFLFLHIENSHRHLIRYEFVYREMISLVLAAAIIFLLAIFVFRKQAQKQALFAFGVLILFYFFCDVKDSIHNADKSSLFGRYVFLIPAVIIAVYIMYRLLKKQVKALDRAFQFLNVLLLIFIINEVVQLAKRGPATVIARQNNVPIPFASCDTCYKPDIYYLLFDGYASSTILEKEFNYPNDEIENFFDLNGFFVADSSRSNYNLTPFSIASVFNLDYLVGVDTSKDYFIKDYLPGLQAVYQSQLAPALTKHGYAIINHSIFDINGFPTKNPHFNLWDIDELYRRHNFFLKVDNDIGWLLRSKVPFKLPVDDGRDYIIAKDQHFLRTVDSVHRTIRNLPPQPAFVYGHFVIPHPSSFLDSTGANNPSDDYPTGIEEAKEKYVEHVALANKTIIRLVNQIQGNGRQSIVIIQGDHGFKVPGEYRPDLEFDNLSAFYFPDRNYGKLYHSMSNVNTFRFIFNQYLGGNFHIKPDSTFFLKYR